MNPRQGLSSPLTLVQPSPLPSKLCPLRLGLTGVVVEGLGLGLGLRVRGLGLRVRGLGLRGLGFSVNFPGCKIAVGNEEHHAPEAQLHKLSSSLRLGCCEGT